VNTWIIGCGDIGRRVARLYQELAKESNKLVKGLVYSETSLQLCQAANIQTIRCDLDDDLNQVFTTENSLQAIDRFDADEFKEAYIFYFAPPPPRGEYDRRLQSFLDTIKGRPEKIVLISTTGVYGDSQGAWIDETYPIAPKADRAKRRVHAETLLSQWATRYQKAAVILRVPGIYAPDRLPLARIKKGLPIVQNSEAGWTNRIHADDLATVCQSAMQLTPPSRIYNVTDGSPSTMTDYFNQVADYAGLARPPQISMQEAIETLSQGMVSYLQESRRISNQKMLNELGIILRYPDLKAGLKKRNKKAHHKR
jgi:nucleoside-diphosphate-sugar epimerase